MLKTRADRVAIRRAFTGLDSITDDSPELVREIAAAGNAFTSLWWLEPFARLQVLDVRHCQIEDVEGIGACRYLQLLDLRDNQLSNQQRLVSSLSCLVKLELCDSRHNPFSAAFSSVDVEVKLALGSGSSSPTPREIQDARHEWRASMIRSLPCLKLLDGLTCDAAERTAAKAEPSFHQFALESQPPNATSSAKSKGDDLREPTSAQASAFGSVPGINLSFAAFATPRVSSTFGGQATAELKREAEYTQRACDTPGELTRVFSSSSKSHDTWAWPATPAVGMDLPLPSVAAAQAAAAAAGLAAQAQLLCDRLEINPFTPACNIDARAATSLSVQDSADDYRPPSPQPKLSPTKRPRPSLMTSFTRTPAVRLGQSSSLALAEAAAAQAANLRDRLSRGSLRPTMSRANASPTSHVGRFLPKTNTWPHSSPTTLPCGMVHTPVRDLNRSGDSVVVVDSVGKHDAGSRESFGGDSDVDVSSESSSTSRRGTRRSSAAGERLDAAAMALLRDLLPPELLRASSPRQAKLLRRWSRQEEWQSKSKHADCMEHAELLFDQQPEEQTSQNHHEEQHAERVVKQHAEYLESHMTQQAEDQDRWNAAARLPWPEIQTHTMPTPLRSIQDECPVSGTCGGPSDFGATTTISTSASELSTYMDLNASHKQSSVEAINRLAERNVNAHSPTRATPGQDEGTESTLTRADLRRDSQSRSRDCSPLAMAIHPCGRAFKTLRCVTIDRRVSSFCTSWAVDHWRLHASIDAFFVWHKAAQGAKLAARAREGARFEAMEAAIVERSRRALKPRVGPNMSSPARSDRTLVAAGERSTNMASDARSEGLRINPSANRSVGGEGYGAAIGERHVACGKAAKLSGSQAYARAAEEAAKQLSATEAARQSALALAKAADAKRRAASPQRRAHAAASRHMAAYEIELSAARIRASLPLPNDAFGEADLARALSAAPAPAATASFTATVPQSMASQTIPSASSMPGTATTMTLAAETLTRLAESSASEAPGPPPLSESATEPRVSEAMTAEPQTTPRRKAAARARAAGEAAAREAQRVWDMSEEEDEEEEEEADEEGEEQKAKEKTQNAGFAAEHEVPMPRPPLEPPPSSLPPSAPQSEPPSILPSDPPSASASAPPSKTPSKPPSPSEAMHIMMPEAAVISSNSRSTTSTIMHQPCDNLTSKAASDAEGLASLQEHVQSQIEFQMQRMQAMRKAWPASTREEQRTQEVSICLSKPLLGRPFHL